MHGNYCTEARGPNLFSNNVATDILLSLLHYQGSVGERVSSLEGTLGHIGSLHSDLNKLLERLNNMRSKLKGHEPPRVLPADVERQLKKLSVSQNQS
jgi:hypothetical protein